MVKNILSLLQYNNNFEDWTKFSDITKYGIYSKTAPHRFIVKRHIIPMEVLKTDAACRCFHPQPPTPNPHALDLADVTVLKNHVRSLLRDFFY